MRAMGWPFVRRRNPTDDLGSVVVNCVIAGEPIRDSNVHRR